eukprot:988017_1
MDHRFERIGTQFVKHDLSYVNKAKEHPIFLKARAFYLNQQWNEAKCEYEKLLRINPHSASYNNSYACILSRFTGPNMVPYQIKAAEYSERAVQLSPHSTQFTRGDFSCYFGL